MLIYLVVPTHITNDKNIKGRRQKLKIKNQKEKKRKLKLKLKCL
jgi:hypothetical protein